jgi:hypothetical protein
LLLAIQTVGGPWESEDSQGNSPQPDLDDAVQTVKGELGSTQLEADLAGLVHGNAAGDDHVVTDGSGKDEARRLVEELRFVG